MEIISPIKTKQVVPSGSYVPWKGKKSLCSHFYFTLLSMQVYACMHPCVYAFICKKVTVKLSLCLIKNHVIKAYKNLLCTLVLVVNADDAISTEAYLICKEH
jgi:hypothetical protein